MKDILMEQEDTQFERFTSVMALADNHGMIAIIQAIHQLLTFKREEIAHCAKCYRKTELLHVGLGQLLLAYELQFPSRVEQVG
jgi:hypothetical protein